MSESWRDELGVSLWVAWRASVVFAAAIGKMETCSFSLIVWPHKLFSFQAKQIALGGFRSCARFVKGPVSSWPLIGGHL